MNTSLGRDIKIGSDLDPSGRSAEDEELAADEILHRLSENTLPMTGAPDDQIEFGEDVRAWAGEALDQTALDAKGPRLAEVLERSPRIVAGSCIVTLTAAKGADASRYNLRIRIQARLASGQPIDRMVGVDQLTVEYLAAGT